VDLQVQISGIQLQDNVTDHQVVHCITPSSMRHGLVSIMPNGANRVTSTSTLETSPLKLQQGGANIHTGLFARFTRDYVLRADP
jgi:hypothetical protein